MGMDVPTFLVRYGFELDHRSAEEWNDVWSERFIPEWIPAALVEALHQGRYKAASVEQLLNLWERRGHPRIGYTLEFSDKVWPDRLDLVRLMRRPANHPDTFIPRSDLEQSLAAIEPSITIGSLVRQLQHQPLPPKLQQLLHLEDDPQE
jgi:hypothetical protein